MILSTIRVVVMRGGTSKATYLHRDDLPPQGVDRDAVLLRLMGSPDPLQIDGLGGSRPITSKVAIIARSARPGTDVDYEFAQVGIDQASVGYSGNCGNISAGVGGFAIDEGLVEAVEPETRVRIHNVNTGKDFTACIPVTGGKASTTGDFSIPGVPGTGARVVLDYSQTLGATTGRLSPTGRPVDTVALEDGRLIRTSVVDAGNCCAFVEAEQLGLTDEDLMGSRSTSPATVAIVREIRGKAAVLAGLATEWRDADAESPGLPMLGFLAPAADYAAADGVILVRREDVDLRARLFFMGRLHETMAGTAAICLAAASRIPGTVAAAMLSDGSAARDTVTIGHPRGAMTVDVRCAAIGGRTKFPLLGISRTARRIMSGTAYL